MQPAEAARYVNDLVFFPEWTITAEAHDPHDFWSMAPPGCIRVTTRFPTRNTNEDDAPNYPWKFSVSPGTTIDVTDLTEDELYGKVADWIVRAWEHEIREALRVPQHDRLRGYGGTRYRAPFHPHRPEGQQLWAKLHHDSPYRQRESVLADERFGL